MRDKRAADIGHSGSMWPGVERAIELLRAACTEAGSASRWAKAHGIAFSYAYGALAGRIHPGAKITTALGLPGIGRERRRTKWETFEDSHIPEPNSGCWLWLGAVTNRGYGSLLNPATGKTTQAHREAYRRAHGAIPPGLHVLHRCDLRCCVNPDHLFVGTNADNVRDRMTKGRHKFGTSPGEAHGRAKLTTATIYTIRASSETPKTLAARYGISRRTVWGIWTRQRWRHIP